MAAKSKKKRVAIEPETEGVTSRIRAVVERVDSLRDAQTIINQIQAVHEGMKKKDRSEVIDAALTKYFRAELLKPYQAELIKLLQHIERTNKKVIILFDGRTPRARAVRFGGFRGS